MSFFARRALRGFSAASCLPKSLIFCVGRRRSVSLCLYSRGQQTASSHLRLNWGRDTPRYVVIWSFYGNFSNSCSPKCPKAQIIDQHKTYCLSFLLANTNLLHSPHALFENNFLKIRLITKYKVNSHPFLFYLCTFLCGLNFWTNYKLIYY